MIDTIDHPATQGEDDHTPETPGAPLQGDLFRLTIVGVMHVLSLCRNLEVFLRKHGMVGDFPHGASLLGGATGEAILEATHRGPEDIAEAALAATRQGIEDLEGAIPVATHQELDDGQVRVHLIVGHQGQASDVLEKATLTAVASALVDKLVIANCRHAVVPMDSGYLKQLT